MGRNHLNLETTLGLVYISATFVVLCALALPLPERFKRTLAPVITQTARVLAYAIVIPAYLTVNAVHSIRRLEYEAPDSQASAHMTETFAYRELKLHRNAMIGVFGLMLSVLLFRFRALLVGGKLFDDEHIVVTAAKRPADAGRAPAAKSS